MLLRGQEEAHELTKTVFEAVAEYLEARGALLRGGTIVDATLIAASPSTKNEAGKRDPQMHSSKKGHFPRRQMPVGRNHQRSGSHL